MHHAFDMHFQYYNAPQASMYSIANVESFEMDYQAHLSRKARTFIFFRGVVGVTTVWHLPQAQC